MNNDINKAFIDSLVKAKKLSYKAMKVNDLYSGEYMTLKAIYRLKLSEAKDSLGVKTSDIGEFLDMKKPAISKMLNNLEDRGYVTRLSNKKDRRVIYVDLTEEGLNLLKQYHQKMVDYTNKIVEKMGYEDVCTLIKLLDKLSDSMKEISEG